VFFEAYLKIAGIYPVEAAMGKDYNLEDFTEYLSKKINISEKVIKWACIWVDRYRTIFSDEAADQREENLKKFLRRLVLMLN
jgi:hypothetical protein